MLALIAMATTARAQVVLNETNFPDANFRTALASKLGISEGDEITEAKIAATSSLKVNSKSIADLTGIEHFTALSWLDCGGNQLTSLDVSKNTALEYLSCGQNQLTALDVSKNTTLWDLDCNNNQLTALDVSKNTALTDLDCRFNQLTSLDVSKNTALGELNCCHNQLTSINVSGCTELWVLNCYHNQLTSLDVSGCTALIRLYCYENRLTSLDVSGCTALTWLDCFGNQLTSLDVSQNTALTHLSCGQNQLTSLDVSKNTALTWLDCLDNQLTSLNVSGCAALEALHCWNNQLTSLDMSKNTALEYLSCNNNQLTSLDVSKNTALKVLYCFSNQIKGEAMDSLVASLPTVESGGFYVINTKDENEGNICTKAQVAVAKEKGWTVFDYNYDGSNWVGSVDYEGSDEAILLDEENFPDDNFRNALSKFFDIPENYEITGDLISVTTKLDISNNKITNTIGIEHLTSLEELWCHCNIIAGEAMAKLIVSLTNLNISEAKGLMLAEETNPRKGALYALDFTDENEQNVCTAEHVEAANAKGWTVYCKTTNGWQEYTGEVPTGIGASLNDNGKMTNDNYYSIDGVKLSGEPTKKGLYIHKGKKVVK